MINKESVENLMKQCQSGFGGATALDNAHGCLAECYGVLGALLSEREELLAQIPKDRTPKQSSSRWLYLEALAKSLNDAGIDRVKLLETLRKTPQVDVPNDKESLYLEYWRPIQKSMYPEAKRPNTKQISMIYETMNRHTIKTFSIGIPWPDKFGQSFSGGFK